ncbi:MAG: biotin/lipoyl-containing protein [Verrucomicrobiales bacterium]
MQIPIVMPQLGESIAEATIVRLLALPGEEVGEGQDIMEVETNKATMTVPSPCAGKVAEMSAQCDASYPVGAVLGKLEVSDADAARLGFGDAPPPWRCAARATGDAPPQPPGGQAPKAARESVNGAGERGGEDEESGIHFKPQKEGEYAAVAGVGVRPTVEGLPVPANATGATYLSPRMRVRMQELGSTPPTSRAWRAPGAAAASRSRTSRPSWPGWRNSGSHRPRRCGSRWRTRCGAAPRARSPRSARRSCWTRCSPTGRIRRSSRT